MYIRRETLNAAWNQPGGKEKALLWISRIFQAIRSRTLSSSSAFSGPNFDDSPPSPLFLELRLISPSFLVAFPNRQKLCMAGRESEVVDKFQPFLGQTVSHDVFDVCFAKFAEVPRVDDDSLNPACLYLAPLEPAPIDPVLNLQWGNMKRNRESVLSEAVAPHGSTGTHTVERMPHRTL